ncbi:hypothetical protein BJX64DRAFT_257292 [Aspergillus heterothallicus]
MQVFSTLVSLALLASIGVATPGSIPQGQDLVGRDGFTTVAAPSVAGTDEAGPFQGELIEDDLIGEDEDFYYYGDFAAIFNGAKPKPKDKCPKKCGKGKHCCPRHFCHASAGKEGKCLGGK